MDQTRYRNQRWFLTMLSNRKRSELDGGERPVSEKKKIIGFNDVVPICGPMDPIRTSPFSTGRIRSSSNSKIQLPAPLPFKTGPIWSLQIWARPGPARAQPYSNLIYLVNGSIKILPEFFFKFRTHLNLTRFHWIDRLIH